ncbi:mitochondrial intermembrane space import and assembly protein 40-B-like [Haliotis cracherodii]|uniref:mitochondrial intermembrane space import and assembly protein 40-B-like n=1 Tax=Haliotis rufescens TaxID=6454 RepID=UPI001EAFB9F0|nr:mitochondrial intermembrane space import and assembly protein 40-B-like [Haliotis rufescens]
MSYCRQEGKDQIIFATKEDLDQPSSALIQVEEEEEPGLILPNGDINWNCPCLGGMASGPCGVPFREAFSCFHYSEADPKGSDCYQQFRSMQDCMTSYPELYPSKDDDEEEADNENKLNNEETKTDSLESLTVANTDKKTEKESS